MNSRIRLALILMVATATAQAQYWAKVELEKSSRHREYVNFQRDGRDVNRFLAYPEVKDKAPAIVVIHEILGLADWPELLADELAEAGYIAIVPNLLLQPIAGRGPCTLGLPVEL